MGVDDGFGSAKQEKIFIGQHTLAPEDVKTRMKIGARERTRAARKTSVLAFGPSELVGQTDKEEKNE